MKIKKAQLDTLISMHRLVWEGDEPQLDEELVRAQCQSKMIYSEKAFGTYLGWSIDNFLSAIMSPLGVRQDAPNEIIYKVFEALGYEVVE